MPLMRCQSGGKPGFKWGEAGKCFAYRIGNTLSRQKARAQAMLQGRAIEASKRKAGK